MDVDIKADRAGVEVLEVVEACLLGFHLDADGAASGTLAFPEVIGIAGNDLLSGKDGVDLGLGGVGSTLLGRGGQEAEFDFTGAGKGK